MVSERNLDGVIRSKSPTTVLNSVRDSMEKLSKPYNTGLSDGPLGFLPTPFLQVLHLFLQIPKMAFLVPAKIWNFGFSVALFPFTHVGLFPFTYLGPWLVSWPMSALLSALAPYNLWMDLLQQYGTEEQINRASHLAGSRQSAFEKVSGFGEDLLNGFGQNSSERAGDRLDKMKAGGDALLGDLSQRVTDRTNKGLNKLQDDHQALFGTTKIGGKRVSERVENYRETVRDAPADFNRNDSARANYAYNPVSAGGGSQFQAANVTPPSSDYSKTSEETYTPASESWETPVSSLQFDTVPVEADETLNQVHAVGDALLGNLHQRFAENRSKIKDLLVQPIDQL